MLESGRISSTYASRLRAITAVVRSGFMDSSLEYNYDYYVPICSASDKRLSMASIHLFKRNQNWMQLTSFSLQDHVKEFRRSCSAGLSKLPTELIFQEEQGDFKQELRSHNII